MMLWKHEEEGTQHKYDLRVYVAVSPDGKAFVYKDAALRTAINEFDPKDLSPKTMVRSSQAIIFWTLLARLRT